MKTQTLYLSLYTNTGKYDLAERPASNPKKGEESTEDTNVLFFSICRTGEGERLTEEQKPLIAMLDLALKTGTLKHTFDLTGVQYRIGNKLSDVSSQRKEVLIRAWNCKKMPGKSAGNCIITVTSQKKNKT